LTVTGAVLVSLDMMPTEPNIALGEFLQLTATATFPDNTTQGFTTFVVWSSSNSNKVTISNEGLVTRINNGAADLTATYSSISVVIKVK
jgi:hypothetical protein